MQYDHFIHEYVKLFNKLEMHDIDVDAIKGKNDGCRIVIAVLQRAVADALNEDLDNQDRCKALYWLVLEDGDAVVRDLALKLMNIHVEYLVRLLKLKMGKGIYRDLLFQACMMPKAKREWV